MRAKTRPAPRCTAAHRHQAVEGSEGPFAEGFAYKRQRAISSTSCIIIIVVVVLILTSVPISKCHQPQGAANFISLIPRQQHQGIPANVKPRQQQQQQILSATSRNDELLQHLLPIQQELLTFPNQHQQQQPRAARQLFISDFVTNQSHRLLKNFVNNTLADLVARQPAIGAGGLTRLIQTNYRRPSLSDAPFASTQEPAQRQYLPAIGKLYSFLFPNQTHQPQQTWLGDSSLASGELIEPSSSDALDFYETTGFGARATVRPSLQPTLANGLRSTTSKFISLSAPYESNQARTSLLQVDALPSFDSASDASDKFHGDKSNETLVAYPDKYDQQQQQSSDAASFTENNQEDSKSIEEDSKSFVMIQEDSQPDIIQATQHADEGEQMNMESDSTNQGGELLSIEEQQNSSSSTLEYEPQDFNHGSLLNNQSSFLNHQMDPVNGSSQSETDTSTKPTLTVSESGDSFLNHLPSSYDSPMRMPPEGYYDDYYKLASSQTTGFENPVMESLLPEQQLYDEYTTMVNGTKPESASGANDAGSVRLTASMARGNHPYSVQQHTKQSSLDSEHRAEHDRTATNMSTNSSMALPNHSSNEQHNRLMRNMQNSTRYEQHAAEQDSIQLILANTNSSFDPINNEKVINYISEGRNVTFQPSTNKSPRHTFVNKDMNELPPLVPESNGNHRNNSFYQPKTPLPASGTHVAHTTTSTPSSQYEDTGGEPSRRPSYQSLSGFNPSSEQSDRDADEEARQTTTESSVTDSSANSYRDEPIYSSRIDHGASHQITTDSDDDHAYDAEKLRRLSLESGQSYGRYNRGNKPTMTSSDMLKKQKKLSEKGASESDRRRELHNHVEPTRRRRQQTIRRPQVTQAHFDPEDLIMRAPTPQPSVTESAVDTLAHLPSKVKKLRENQPDKNELMNELLTALDRVKVAIYKLQPLTAKMNAIYRKSVTSNTRDTVLDNNKGTYAKRYPPGDYDDSYDKMNPSELLLTRTNPAASSRKGRRAPRANPSRHPRRMMVDNELAEESVTSATYLPAPASMANGVVNNSSQASNQSLSKFLFDYDVSGKFANEIVATGIGHRMGDGRFKGEVLSFGSVDDGEDLKEKLANQFASATRESTDDSYSPAVPMTADLDMSPTFGYRITIYRPSDADDPESEQQVIGSIEGDESSSSARERLSYSIDGNDSPEFDNNDAEQDMMVTSESSIVETTSNSIRDNRTKVLDSEGSEILLGDESREEERKKMSEKWEKKKEKKEKESKKGGKSQKSQEKKKKGDEESKKKKEYKKIKHNKGLISKESKKMHRDKHIKAHDRGAAKEKALKERTQIEFFEREQIVDDEFEKGKKSTVKAGWQSGHEAKKSMKDISGGGGGDSMSMGGSHYVAHEQPSSFSEKGHGSSVESSSGKKSNRFEKKDIESKGKKFKGWREKGYKIITETEFIDRGSLHDSAYKKRDKGAAHHQKYKKQEASSEGHHGSMQEHHKKSHKKEEKNEKMQEKHMKKGEDEQKKKEKGEKKKKKMKEKGKGKEEAEEGESMIAATISPNDETIELMNQNQRSRQPILVSQRTYHFAPDRLVDQQKSSALSRLLTVEHDSEPSARLVSTSIERPYPGELRQNISDINRQQRHLTRQEYLKGAPAVTVDSGDHRRSDNFVSEGINNNQAIQKQSNSSALFDIVDNQTGQRINKTRVGIYQVDDQTPRPLREESQHQRHPNLAQEFDHKFLTAPSAPVMQPPIYSATTTTKTTTTTQKPKQVEKPSDSNTSVKSELDKLVSLLRTKQTVQRQPEPAISPSRPYDSVNSLSNLVNSNQQLTSTIARSYNNNSPPPLSIQLNSQKGVAGQNFLQQLRQRASVAATTNNLNNPVEMLDSFGNSFISPQNQIQTSFLPHAPTLPMSAVSEFQQTSYFAPPPTGQYESGLPASQPASSILFSNEQLFDYDPETMLAANLHSSFVTD